MDLALLKQHWALVAAAAIALLVAVVVAVAVYGRSARGRLRVALRSMRAAMRERDRARRRVTAATQRDTRLEGRVAKVSPRSLDEARGLAGDAGALLRIAEDRVLVTANEVRMVIYEQFPPTRHARLRQRYLPGDME